MGKYGGLPGVYYYGRKDWADQAARNAREKGYNARVNKWFDLWEIVVTRSRRKAKK